MGATYSDTTLLLRGAGEGSTDADIDIEVETEAEAVLTSVAAPLSRAVPHISHSFSKSLFAKVHTLQLIGIFLFLLFNIFLCRLR